VHDALSLGKMLRFIPLLSTTPVFGSVEFDSRPVPHVRIRADSCLDMEIGDGALARAQATFFVTNTSQSIPGFLYLDISNNYDVGEPELAGVDRVLVGETVLDLSGRLQRPPLSAEPIRALYAGAALESTFATQVGSFLFNPINDTNAQIVIAPTNATDYAGEIHYAGVTSLSFWKLAISVGIVGEESTPSTPEECKIVGKTNMIIVPRRILNHVFERFQALGIDADLSRMRGSIQLRSPITPAQIDALPSIEFSFNDDNGDRISIAQVSPREYVKDGQRGRGARVLLQAGPSCLLTGIVSRKLVIHFDVINNRIGFGKPLRV